MATKPLSDLTATWNNVATTFTGIGLNVTDTTSAATSMLIDLQVGGTTQFHVLKSGAIHSKRSNYNITNANAASILVSNYSLTGSDATSMFDLAGTWNTSGTPTALKLNMTDTASAAGSLLIDLQKDSVSQFSISKTGGVTGLANVLEVRNGVNAQTFRVYNTFTDASNYERGFFRFNSNVLRIGFEAGGTGSTRAMQLMSVGFAFFGINDTGGIWNINGSGHFIAGTDNSVDIGATGANRPRNIYMASWIRMAVTTVASLPAAATAGAGARMMVSDALAPVFGSAVAGSGAVTVPVYSTGAAWNVG